MSLGVWAFVGKDDLMSLRSLLRETGGLSSVEKFLGEQSDRLNWWVDSATKRRNHVAQVAQFLPS